MTGKKFDIKKWLLQAVLAFFGLFVVGFFIEVVYLVAKGQPFQEAWQRYLAESLSTTRLISRGIIALGISLYFMFRSPQRGRRQSD
ncbi:MAG: hypothetical protein MUF62_01145 [Chitinophagaceae bacterium]|jgi:hypothetical protein|nr:hypothetical protein [Chitinophagaceae bacterium]